MSPTVLPTARRQVCGITGRHVLFAMLAFFGVIFVVNGVLLWKAIATHSGLVANEPYRKGLHYNERIDADQRQQAFGWSDTIAIDGRNTVTFTLTNRAAQPIGGLEVSGTIGRPSTIRHDAKLRFVEQVPGRYVAEVALLEPGAWLVAVEAKPAVQQAGTSEPVASPVFRSKRRLWLKP